MKEIRSIALCFLAVATGCSGGAGGSASRPMGGLEESAKEVAAPPPPPPQEEESDDREAPGAVVANVHEETRAESDAAAVDPHRREPPKAKDTKKKPKLGESSPKPDKNEPSDQRPGGSSSPAPMAATTTGAGAHLSEDDVSALISPYLKNLRRCANTDATVSIRLAVASGGQILSASATRSAPDDAELRDCVTTVFKQLSFARADGGTTLAFDLSLKPLARP